MNDHHDPETEDRIRRALAERADGTVDTVTVVTGLNARSVGLVEITPVDGRLEPGDRVVVGRNTPTSLDDEGDEAGDGDESENGDGEGNEEGDGG